MPVTKTILTNKLKDKIISDVNFPNVPIDLRGEILLEEHKDKDGKILGWQTITVDTLLSNIQSLSALTLEALVVSDPQDSKGYRRFFEKWKTEGTI